MQKLIRSSLLSLIASIILVGPLTAQAARVPMAFQGGWDAKVKYRRGDVVVYNNALYQSVRSQSLGRRNIGSVPGASAPDWRLVLGVSSTTPTPGNPTPTPTPTTPTAPVAQDCSKPTVGANLAGCDLTENAGLLKDLKLQGINLSGATLTGDAGNVDLTGAILRSATLGIFVSSNQNNPSSPANKFLPFKLGSGAILSYADLSGTKVPAAPSGGTMVADGANFEGATFASASLLGISLKGANLQKTNFENAALNDAKLIGADFTGANLRNALLQNADLTNARFDNAILTTAQFDNATVLVSTTFSNADMRNTGFGSNDLRGAVFGNVNLSGAVGLDTATVGLDPATGQETTFENTICPDGVKADGVSVTTCVGHGVGP